MQRMYRIVCVVLVVLFITVFSSGCFGIAERLTKKHPADSSTTENAKLKQNVNTYYGQSAAMFEERIYYVSQEIGQDGIYSMAQDGSDVRFEFELPRIKRLIVREEGFYYVGFREYYRDDRMFSLYCFDPGTGETQDMMHRERDIETVEDAFISADGIVSFLEEHDTSAGVWHVTRIEGIHIGDDFDDDESRNAITTINGEEWQSLRLLDNYVLVQNENMIFSRIFYREEEERDIAGLYDSSFYDKVSCEIVMDNIKERYPPYFKIVGMKDRTIWCALNNMLLEVDEQTLEVAFINMMRDTNEDMITLFMFLDGDVPYVLMKNRLTHEMKLRSPYLYASAFESMDTFFEDKLLLHINERGIMWAQADKIVLSEFVYGKIGKAVFEIAMPEDITEGNIFELCGDWLFIHELSETDKSNRLLYKINVNTQEVVEVR